jgi:hypothetical protein
MLSILIGGADKYACCLLQELAASQMDISFADNDVASTVATFFLTYVSLSGQEVRVTGGRCYQSAYEDSHGLAQFGRGGDF